MELFPNHFLRVEFASSPGVCEGSLWFPSLPPVVQRDAVSGIRLTGDSK